MPTPTPATMKPGQQRRPARRRASTPCISSSADADQRRGPTPSSTRTGIRAESGRRSGRRRRRARQRQEAQARLRAASSRARPGCRSSGRGTSRTSRPRARRRPTETPVKAGLRNSDRSSIGCRAARLDHHEGDQQDHRRRPARRRSGRSPQPSALPRIRPKISRNRPSEKATRPGRSIGSGSGRRRWRACVSVSTIARDPDRDVDEEDPLPAEALGDQAADQRPDRDGAADRRPPDAERRRPVVAVELLRDQRQRGREHRRAADALQPAGQVEQRRVAGDAAEERGEGEDRRSRARRLAGARAGRRASPP